MLTLLYLILIPLTTLIASDEITIKQSLFSRFNERDQQAIQQLVTNFNDEEKTIIGSLYEDQIDQNEIPGKISILLQNVKPKNASQYKKAIAPLLLATLLCNDYKNELFNYQERIRLNSIYDIDENSNENLYIKSFETIFPKTTLASKKLQCRYYIARYNTKNKTIPTLHTFIQCLHQYKFASMLKNLDWLNPNNIKEEKLKDVLQNTWKISVKNNEYQLKFLEIFEAKKDVIFDSQSSIIEYSEIINNFLSLQNDKIPYLLENTCNKDNTVFANIFFNKFSFALYCNPEFISQETLIRYITILNNLKNYDEIKTVNNQDDIKPFFQFYISLNSEKDKTALLTFLEKYIDYTDRALENVDMYKNNFDLQCLGILKRRNFINQQTIFAFNPNEAEIEINEIMNWREFADLYLNQQINYIKFYERILKETHPSNHKSFQSETKDIINIIREYDLVSLENVRRTAISCNYYIYVRILADYFMNKTNNKPNFTEVLDIDMLYCAIERCKNKIENTQDESNDTIILKRIYDIYNEMCINNDTIEIKLKNLDLVKVNRENITKEIFDTLKRVGIIHPKTYFYGIWYKDHPYILGFSALAIAGLFFYAVNNTKNSKIF